MSPHSSRLVAVAIALVLTGAAAAGAQSDTTTVRVDSAGRRHTSSLLPTFIGGWAAGAHGSEFRTRTGVPGRRDFYLLGVRFGWPLGGYDPRRAVNGQFFIDVLPLAVSTGMPEYHWDRWCRPGFTCPGASPIRHTVYAYGLAPLGWALSIGGERARLTFEASGGGLLFSRPIPDPEAARFNFTASAGPTLDVTLSPSGRLRLGYLWHHTSNGGRGRINPGLNTGILSAGVLYHVARRDR